MKSAEILSKLPSNAKATAIASKLEGFIHNVTMENKAISFKRMIAAYLTAGRYNEIKRGILLTFDPLHYSITSTYDYLVPSIKIENKKKITLPIFDNAEYALAERLFDMFTKNEYLLSNPAKLGKTIAALRKNRYHLDDVFSMQFNTTSLRTLRLHALLTDYGDSHGIDNVAVWSLYLRPYAFGKFFGLDKEKMAEEAMVGVAKLNEKSHFLDKEA